MLQHSRQQLQGNADSSPLHLVLRIVSPESTRVDSSRNGDLHGSHNPRSIFQTHPHGRVTLRSSSSARVTPLPSESDIAVSSSLPTVSTPKATFPLFTERRFTLPHVFSGADDDLLFDTHVRPHLDCMLHGLTVTVICLGEAGSGVDRTLMGSNQSSNSNQQGGVAMRALEHLLQCTAQRANYTDSSISATHANLRIVHNSGGEEQDWGGGGGGAEYSDNIKVSVRDMVRRMRSQSRRQFPGRQEEKDEEGDMYKASGEEDHTFETEWNDGRSVGQMVAERKLQRLWLVEPDNATMNFQQLMEFVQQEIASHTTTETVVPSHLLDITTITLEMRGKGATSRDAAIVGTLHLVRHHYTQEDEGINAMQGIQHTLAAIHRGTLEVTANCHGNISNHNRNDIGSLLTQFLSPALDPLCTDNASVVAIIHALDELSHHEHALKALQLCNSILYGNVKAIEKKKQRYDTSAAEMVSAAVTTTSVESAKLKTLNQEISRWKEKCAELERRQQNSVRPFVSMDDRHGRELARERERREKAERQLQTVLQECADLRHRISLKDQAVAKMQESFLKEQEEMRRSLQEYRARYNTLEQELRDTRQNSQNTVNQLENKYREEIESLRTQHQADVDQVMGMYLMVPENIRALKTHTRKKQQSVQATRESMSGEHDSIVRSMLQKHQEATQQLHEMQRRAAEHHSAEMRELRKVHDTQREQWYRERSVLVREVATVFEYADKLSTVVRNMETGKYPVVMRHGTRCLQIDDSDKPQPLRAELLPHIADRIHATQDFIRICQQQEPKTRPASAPVVNYRRQRQRQLQIRPSSKS